jgi:hypothetical protein
MQLKAKRQTKKHMKQKTKVNKKNIRSKNTQRRFRNKRRTKKKRSHKGGTYYSECKALLKDIFLELEGEKDTKSVPNDELIYRKIKNREALSKDDEYKIEKYMYYTNIPDKTEQETINKLITVVKKREQMGYKRNLIIEMLNHFEMYGFLNKNKLSERMNHLEKCNRYTEFQLAEYARSGYLKHARSGYTINKNMHISTFLSTIKSIYAMQTFGIDDLKELIKTDNRKEIDLIRNIEKHNPDNNNLTQNINLTKNTKEWMELFESCLEVLKGKDDDTASIASTSTAPTAPLTDESDSDNDSDSDSDSD